MKTPSSRVFGVAAILLIAAIGVAVASLIEQRTYSRLDRLTDRMTEEEFPLALSEHLEKLAETIPGRGGESLEGPGGAGEEKFFALAYPANDVALSLLQGARGSAEFLASKAIPSDNAPGTWVLVGPSQAVYPNTQFRNSFGYVPNRYVAGGRATSLAIDPNCVEGSCRLWVYAAGGGLWRTNDALNGNPQWQYLSVDFGINSGSAVTLDPNDSTGNTLYVGTGEANASGDSAGGVGLYRSTNGGDTFVGPLGASVFAGRSIASIAIPAGSPSTIYVATTRGVFGVSSVTGGGATLVPGAAPWGLYKSTDSGATWTFLHDGSANRTDCDTVAKEIAPSSPCSLRGVRRIAMDPANPSVVYAGSYSRGIWRSSDGGATWIQINPSLSPANANTRPEFAVTLLSNGNTRMYVHEGSTGDPTSRLSRSDSVRTGSPVFANLTSSNIADPGYGTFDLCDGQCWYDNFVYTPPGHPDIVYVGGSYAYGESFSNKRGVVLSTDAGVTSTDMTMDGTDFLHPNGLHPDQHALVTNPNNPFQFFEVNDGGLMRSNGTFSDASAFCDQRSLSEPALSRCRQLLSRVPKRLISMNIGLSTLQFQSLSVSPFDSNLLQGGTQDNGTWQSDGDRVKWVNTMIGDGGQSGFDVASPSFRFHTFFAATPDVNFSDGDIADWNWIGDPIYGTEPQAFYVPIITDPVVSKTMFVGTSHVWRTKTWGMGSMGLNRFRNQCNEWFGKFQVTCGDWVPLGDPSASGWLTSTSFGSDRAGGAVAAVERATTDSSTLWAATQTGRVFISKNADAKKATAVTFTRLDTASNGSPGRFVSGIYIDSSNPYRVWISYSGFGANTPATPGHVYQVTYDPNLNTAAWVDVSHDFGDIPANDVVRDDLVGDLYAATDFGVFRLASGTTDWVSAAPGMPNVEVSGLTIVPSARRLYAATHGRSAWRLRLP